MMQRGVFRLPILFALTVLFFLNGFAGLWAWTDALWFHWGSYPTNWAGYNTHQFIGLITFVTCVPAGGCCLLVLSSHMASTFTTSAVKIAYFVFVLIFCLTGVCLSFLWARDLISCGVFWCHGTQNLPPWPPATEGFLAILGLTGFVVFGVFFLAHVWLTLRSLDRTKGFDPQEKTYLLHKTRDIHGDHRQDPPHWPAYRIALLGGVLFYFGWFFMMSSYMPNSWEYFTPHYMAQLANVTITGNEDLCGVWPYYSCPERPGSSMRSVDIKVSDSLHLHFWIDTLLFYGLIFFLIIAGSIIRIKKSFIVPFVPSFGFSTVSVAFGSVMVWGIVLVILCVWIYYWAICHNWDGFWPGQPNATIAENVARTSGTVAIFLESLLLLPASRNSIIGLVFGKSWDSVIYAHKALGYGFLVSIIVHFVGWIFAYSQQGVFPHDIFAIPAFRLAQVDNFTVPLITYTSIATLICIGVFSFYKIREKYFELFYATHHIFLVMIPVSMWHAASGWYFLAPCAGLWLVDRVIRFLQSSRSPPVQSATVIGDIIEIVVEYKKLIGSFLPGQYIFINIPEVSLFEWHPVTISSSPSDGLLTVHIKARNSDTWTGRLHTLVSSLDVYRAPVSPLTHGSMSSQIIFPTICIDGPYGENLRLSQYGKIVLFAGGIGATPCHSCFRYLYQRARIHGGENVPAHVQLVWVAKTSDTFAIFSRTLAEVTENPMGRFFVSLYVSRPELQRNVDSFSPNGLQSESASALPSWQHGRPSPEVILRSSQLWPDQKGLVYACGPPDLLKEVSRAAVNCGYTVHAEEFCI